MPVRLCHLNMLWGRTANMLPVFQVQQHPSVCYQQNLIVQRIPINVALWVPSAHQTGTKTGQHSSGALKCCLRCSGQTTWTKPCHSLWNTSAIQQMLWPACLCLLSSLDSQVDGTILILSFKEQPPAERGSLLVLTFPNSNKQQFNEHLFVHPFFQKTKHSLNFYYHSGHSSSQNR